MPDNVTHKFDDLLSKWGDRRAIPLAFLRALASRESDMNPRSGDEPGKKESSAKGLLQVIGVVREDYNEEFGTHYTPKDLFDPDINVKIATRTLGRIRDAYAKHRCLKPDWDSRRWVELYTFGWNAGYSEAAGVGFVVGKLEKDGLHCDDITIDTVSNHAGEFGASPYLTDEDKVRWCKGVASLYFRLRGKDPAKKSKSLTVGKGLILGGLVYLGVRLLVELVDEKTDRLHRLW